MSVFSTNLQALRGQAKEPPQERWISRADAIAGRISEQTGITVHQLRMLRQKRNVNGWTIRNGQRELALKLRNIGWSYPEIARYMGGRHHTSVMYLLGVVRKK